MANPWPWPNGAQAAVSLCYDDGNVNNLDQAIPDLEAAGYWGSFCLHLGRGDVQAHAGDWRAAHKRGHEIASHSWHHNCRVDLYGVRHAWISRPLEEYTHDDMAAEVARCADWLDNNIGPDADRHFAYPCGHHTLGLPASREAYAAAVRPCHRFARSVVAQRPNDPRMCDLELIDSVYFQANTLAEFQGAVQAAQAAGGWLCLGMHGVGGPSHTTERAVHQALLRWLHDQPVWVAPVKTVAVHVEARRAE